MLFVRHNWRHPFYYLFLLVFRALNIYIVKLFSVAYLISFLHVDWYIKMSHRSLSWGLILFYIFPLVDIKSGFLALMEDLFLKRLNSAHKLTDIESDELAR